MCQVASQVMCQAKGNNIVITEQWLEELGFDKVHMNPDWKGGFFRYYLSLPGDRSELVVSFGDKPFVNEHGFMACLSTFMSRLHFEGVVTQEDLQQLCRFVTMKTIEECVAETSAMDQLSVAQ